MPEQAPKNPTEEVPEKVEDRFADGSGFLMNQKEMQEMRENQDRNNP